MLGSIIRVGATVVIGSCLLGGCSTQNGGDPGDGGATDAADATVSDGGGTDAWLDPNHLPDGAPNPSLGLSDCTSCTAQTPCGWCNNHCLAGTASASFDGTCSGSNWMWRGVQCPGTGLQCPMHTDCQSCAMDENSCGWCTNTHSCVAGDQVGPAQPVDGCSPQQSTWIYNLNTMSCP